MRAFEGDFDVVAATATAVEAIKPPRAAKVWFDNSNTPPPLFSSYEFCSIQLL